MKKLNLKNIKYGSNSLIMVVVVIAIVIILNVLVSVYDYSLDLTKSSIFSLSNQTVKVIESVTKADELRIVALFEKNNSNYSLYTNVLENYGSVGGNKIKIEYFNPTENPGLYADLGIDHLVSVNETSASKTPVFVIKGKNKSKIITLTDLVVETVTTNDSGEEVSENKLNIEAAITGGINHVISDFNPKAYWLEGHGELPISGNYEEITQFLQLNNYSFDMLNVMANGKIPKDCSMLICASPESDWSEDERNIIYKYLNAGGSLFLMMDAAEKNIQYTNIKKVINEYNVDFENNKLVETSEGFSLANDKRAFLSTAVATKMNEDVADYKILLRNPRSVKILQNNLENVNATPLLATTEAAYTEDLMTAKRVPGQHYAAAAADRMPNGILTRLIVMGDSGFMSDSTINALGGNSTYTTRTVLTYFNWLLNEDDGIVISPKSVINNSLVITREQIVTSNIITMIIIPLAVLILGFVIWFRRRHK